MNPDRIYGLYRDEAFAQQAIATEYSTFVAMPFADIFSFRATEVHREVFERAAEIANGKGACRRKFAAPRRVDQLSGQAKLITDEIILLILQSHFFLGDLTFQNAGVLLETGIAFGLKANDHMILVMQGKLSDLHFDIRNNNVITYNSKDGPEKIADALIAAAKAFELRVDSYLSSLKARSTPDAMICLAHYVVAQLEDKRASLHSGSATQIFKDSPDAKSLFFGATSELLNHRLMRTEFNAISKQGKVEFGMHTTELGKLFAAHIWPDEAKKLGWIA